MTLLKPSCMNLFGVNELPTQLLSAHAPVVNELNTKTILLISIIKGENCKHLD